MRPRVVFFDLDDTVWDLVHTMQRAHEEWGEAMRKLPGGSKLVEAHVDWRSWTDASVAFAEIKKARPDLVKDLPAIRKEALKLACEAQGVNPNVLVEPGYDAWTAARNRPMFFEGAIELLSDLKSRGLVIGVISDGFAELSQIPQVSSLVDFAVFAKDVGASKPDAKIFHAAMAKASEVLGGACVAGECMMVGDSHQKDVAGAQAVGMRAVWFDNPASFPRAECGQARPASPLSPEPDCRVLSFHALAAALRDITAP